MGWGGAGAAPPWVRGTAGKYCMIMRGGAGVALSLATGATGSIQLGVVEQGGQGGFHSFFGKRSNRPGIIMAYGGTRQSRCCSFFGKRSSSSDGNMSYGGVG